MEYILNPHFDMRYGKVSLEDKLEEPQQVSYSLDIPYAPLTTSAPTYEAPPVISYCVQGLDWAKDKVVQFLPHYAMPWRDFIRGMINFGTENGTYTVVVNSEQTADQTAETVLHETGPEGHGNAGGHDEEKVTNYNYRITHQM